MDRYFPVVKIQGSAENRGWQHGVLLKDRIHRTLSFYKKQFLLPHDEILNIARHFQASTRAFSADLCLEIESLAQAAEVDPVWIYALNGRTELLNLNPMECTTLAFKKQRLIGQNWDWDMELEALAIILDIVNEHGHRIMTMTEPGMIGKIGMNSCGLGVCLNFMSIESYKPYGIPLHVLLRTILDCTRLDEALSLLENQMKGKVGNILMADAHGEIVDIELAGDENFFLPCEDRFVHTNHFLTKVDYDLQLFPHSVGRYERARALLDMMDEPSLSSMKALLKDNHNQEFPICRRRFDHPWLTDDTSITVTSIIMDLQNLQFHITRGNPFNHPYSVFSLKPSDP
jgi:isopenicillin-N N-acyltransferase-like protein